MKFEASQPMVDISSYMGTTLSEASASTKKNIPVTFSGGKIDGKFVGLPSLGTSPGVTQIKTQNGVLKLLNPSQFILEYTPNESFVGLDTATVYVTDDFGHSIPGQVTIAVGNILNIIEPVLAVRGLSCITCHSNVSSNVVTDYGMNSPWYFDTKTSDSFYADRLNSATTLNGLATLNLLNSSLIVVPKGQAPAAIQTQFNINSLADFVRARFAQGSSNSAAQVKEVKNLHIRIPSAQRIAEVFGNPTGKYSFLPDTQNSPALAGLSYDSNRDVFIIRNLTCDGDLYLSSPAVFEKATVRSTNGCRIYSTASVFINGNLVSAPFGESSQFNTQILSARSIWMGAGRIIKNNAFCEAAGGKPVGWYSSTHSGVDCKLSTTDPADPRCDTLSVRMGHLLARNAYSRGAPDTNSLKSMFTTKDYNSQTNGLIADEKARIEAGLGAPLYDASCDAGGRAAFDFSRLVLAAPYVNSRYTGNFSGSIVSEISLMSLGTFKFHFDPVLKNVSVFSLLNSDELVSVQF